MNSNSRKLLMGLAVWAIFAFDPGIASAYRVIQAAGADGTYCSGAAVSCDANVTITRWFVHTVPFWVNQDAESDAADPNLTRVLGTNR